VQLADVGGGWETKFRPRHPVGGQLEAITLSQSVTRHQAAAMDDLQRGRTLVLRLNYRQADFEDPFCRVS
jgi:hypothetical protein